MGDERKKRVRVRCNNVKVMKLQSHFMPVLLNRATKKLKGVGLEIDLREKKDDDALHPSTEPNEVNLTTTNAGN